MIKKIFSRQVNSITLAAGLVAISSLLSRLLGVFRDRILAGEFGAGHTLDVYYAAFRIPDFIYNLLILGALSAGFIPVFTRLIQKEKGEKEAWDFVSDLINIIILSIAAISLAGIIFAPGLIRLIAPGFSPADQAATVNLTRIMFLSPLLLGLSGVFGGVLQSFKHFFVYSLAPVLYNIGIIIGALFFVPILGTIGLAWGVVFGAFIHMAVQMPTLFKLGYRYSWKFDFKNGSIKKIGMMMIPRTLSLATTQINLFVITIVASTLATGSLAIFNLANNLQTFPVGIFAISFAVAAFPAFSAAGSDNKKLAGSFSGTARQILFFIIPSSILLLTLRAQIIRVVLGSGRFGWEDTVLTMNTLAFFTLSLFAQALVPLLVRVFYAQHDSKTPFTIGLLSDGANVILSYWLSAKLGVAGLALAFSLSSIMYFVMLWLVLHNRLGTLEETKILLSVVKFSAAGMMAGAAVQTAKSLVWPYVDMTKTTGVFTQGFVAGSAGIAVYLFISFLLRSEELFQFWDGFKRRLSWKKLSAEDQAEARGV